MELAGKRALVCGSTQGIGRATAQLLATRGASVTLLARNAERLAAVLGELEGDPSPAHQTLCADFSETEQLGALVRADVDRNGPFHVLVNNTGGPPAGPVFEASTDAFVDALRLHVLANQTLAQTVVPGMKEAGYGRIINIVSTSVREPIPNLGVSNTTRAAVAGWAKTLSRELAPSGITVNNVLPGYTNTDRITTLIQNLSRKEQKPEAEIAARLRGNVPMGRFAEPEEIAAAVAFLASPGAAYISGVSLPVDGGRLQSI